MIVFYLKETGECMLAIDCEPSEITVENNKAYWQGRVVNNNMTISAYAEVPKQSIYAELMGDEGMPIRVPKLFSELAQGTVAPSDGGRIAALEDAIIALSGV
jgi:hypothetical protein